MKKVLLAFAVASIFAACGDSKTKTESTTDSTTVKVDSTVIPTTDTTKTVVVDSSATKMSKDTTKKK